jgi:LemA protein
MQRRPSALLAVAIIATGCGYNTIQSLDEHAAQAQQNIEVQLQRRADLIPNLVNTVKGFAQQEQTIFIAVANAQRGLVGALQRPGGSDPEELANANANLTRTLTPFFTLVQAYPQLQSNQQFLSLQDELKGTENRIAVARTDYNEAVNQYNTYIRRFPATVTARATGAKPRKYFQVTEAGAREVPTVDFSTPSGGAPGTGGAPAQGTPSQGAPPRATPAPATPAPAPKP